MNSGALAVKGTPVNPTFAAKKLFTSFKKAAWISATTLLVLFVPLVIELDREQQILEMEKEQMSVLTGPAGKSA